ncbi:Biotin carboxylase [compost metagenome]
MPPYYDSLLAKLIVHGCDRAQALARARVAVAQTRLSGMATTLGLHAELLEQPWLHDADFHTGTLETWLAERRSGGEA